MIELDKVPNELFAPILAGNLRQVGPSRKLVGHFLEAAQRRLGAEACWLTRAGQGERLLPGGRLLAGDPALGHDGLSRAFLRRERPAIPAGVVLATLAVHGRQVAVVGACRSDGELGVGARRVLERLCGVLAQELEHREEERLTRVLDRIREKVVSELRPRDLAYQILDGLHQLVDYDHSSTFLAYDRESGAFRIEAEKIVWTKAKSPFVGREIRLPPERVGQISSAIEIHALAGALGGVGAPAAGESSEVSGPAAASGAPAMPAGLGAGSVDPFHELLEYHRDAGSPPVTSLLSAPLFYDGEFLGILKIGAWRRPPFARRDVEVVERFLPAAAVSMRNARVNRSLEMQAVEAEVKAGLVTLAHAVAHDVNNAVGSILPLAQQMRFELRHGGTEDLETFDRDLGVIIDNARLCQRIFSNMLRVASSGRGGESECPVDAAQVVAETMPFLLALAGRRGIEIALDLAPGLPAVRAWRQDLQHIVLNLVRNSLQALAEKGERPETAEDPDASEAGGTVPGDGRGDGAPRDGREGRDGRPRGGGRVEIAVRAGEGATIELAVTDNGPGIPPELLSKVQEPFFSTRPGSTGLGLAICRALAWQNGGTLTIESPVAAGGSSAAAPAAAEAAALAAVPALAEVAVLAGGVAGAGGPFGAGAVPAAAGARGRAAAAMRGMASVGPAAPGAAAGGAGAVAAAGGTRVIVRLGAEVRAREGR